MWIQNRRVTLKKYLLLEKLWKVIFDVKFLIGESLLNEFYQFDDKKHRSFSSGDDSTENLPFLLKLV